MALDKTARVDVPEHSVMVKNGDKTYVQYTVRAYRNSKGKPTSQRVSIGKLDAESGKLIPNQVCFPYLAGSPYDHGFPLRAAEPFFKFFYCCSFHISADCTFQELLYSYHCTFLEINLRSVCTFLEKTYKSECMVNQMSAYFLSKFLPFDSAPPCQVRSRSQ